MREFDKAYRMQVTSAPPTEPGSPGEGPSGLRVVPVAGLAEDVLKRSGIRRGMRVLDLECGTGETSLDRQAGWIFRSDCQGCIDHRRQSMRPKGAQRWRAVATGCGLLRPIPNLSLR